MLNTKQIQKLKKEIETAITDLVHISAPSQEKLKAFLQEVAKDIAWSAKAGYTDVMEELKDQILLYSEKYRIRISREMKKRLFILLKAVLKIVSSLVRE
jgi:uncharacterized protein YihD (DUF1040 family)